MAQILKSTVAKINSNHVDKVVNFLSKYKAEGGINLLSGAGLSTDSGIPDYRGPAGVYVKNPDFKPITYNDFVSSTLRRKRYWLRSYFGFTNFNKAKPNLGHLAIKDLQDKEYINYVITQNVDNLHKEVATSKLVEMHGNLNLVRCVNPKCNSTIDRTEYQNFLSELNPIWYQHLQNYLHNKKLDNQFSLKVSPDGDIILPETLPFHEFQLIDCFKCGSYMKPDVVFFGENMQVSTRVQLENVLKFNKPLLVVGSSLTIPSAYRIVYRSLQENLPVVIINLSPTRVDDKVKFRIEDNCSQILNKVVEILK